VEIYGDPTPDPADTETKGRPFAETREPYFRDTRPILIASCASFARLYSRGGRQPQPPPPCVSVAYTSPAETVTRTV
jgi:hypothetical protein